MRIQSTAGSFLIAGASALAILTPADQVKADSPRAETAPNNSWVSLSGTVVSTTPDSFRLDYSDGIMTIEMDDFDFYHEGRNLMVNDQVVVFGRVDDDFFEKRTIEAGSVYVENLQTHFYASSVDEEDWRMWGVVAGPITVGRLDVDGTVTSIDGRKFSVDTGMRKITVDTSTLDYNPLDDAGFLRVDVGDHVKVIGDLTRSFFEGRELEANWIAEYGK